MSDGKWIGVDLDGTLAIDSGSIDRIGDVVPEMRARVWEWLDQGIDVRIVTARVAASGRVDRNGVVDDEAFAAWQRQMVEAWCLHNLLRVLPIQANKDFMMAELWDDRAVQVVKDTGMRVDAVHCPGCECDDTWVTGQ